MIEKPQIQLIRESDKSIIKKKEFDFYRYTEFQPIGIENLLNKSFDKFFQIYWDSSEITISQKRLENKNEYIENHRRAKRSFLKKFQFIAMYKLNWNVPDQVLNKLAKVVSTQFNIIYHFEVLDAGYLNITAHYYNIFVEIFLADILIIFIKEIINRTEIGRVLFEDNYLKFHHLLSWAYKFSELIKSYSKNFDNIFKGIIWFGIEKDDWFIWNLTYENTDIRKLINNERCFDKYLGIIQQYYSDLKIKNLESELKNTRRHNQSLINIMCTIEEFDRTKKNLKEYFENTHLRKNIMNPFINKYIENDEFSVGDITITILSEDRLELKIKNKKAVHLTYEQFGFSYIRKGISIHSSSWNTLLEFCKNRISSKNNKTRVAINRLNSALQKEFNLINEEFFETVKQKEGYSIYKPRFTLHDRFYLNEKPII